MGAKTVMRVLGGLLLAGAGALYLYTLPGIRRLPKEGRKSLEGVTTIEEAVERCRQSGLSGWELAALAQDLAARKFSYSRRNPWDTPGRAFERGMGYCQQQALAMKQIYDRLGIDARPVYALKCKFPARTIHGMPEPGGMSPHTWLEVNIGGEKRYVCTGRVGNTPGSLHFEILSEARPLSGWMQPFTHMGSVIENVRRDQRALARAGSSVS